VSLDDFTKSITWRSRWARDHNGGRPDPAWSTGERLAVALVLGDQGEFAAEDCTWEDAARRIEAEIIFDGWHDSIFGWLDQIRAALRENTNG